MVHDFSLLQLNILAKCDCSVLDPVGVSDERIPKENMRADSVLFNEPGSSFTGASEARLNNKPSKNGEGAWVPINVESCLYVVFNKLEQLKEMRTQGHPTKEIFSRRYTIKYKQHDTEDSQWAKFYQVF